MTRYYWTVLIFYILSLFSDTVGSVDFSMGGQIQESNPPVVLPDISCSVERELAGLGFHRDLKTNIRIVLAESQVQADEKCEVLLRKNLSPSFYVDLYQIENGREFGGPKVFSFDEINLEEPEFLSSPLTVFVFRPLELSSGSLSSSISIPLHVRYHRPTEGTDRVLVKLVTPQVFLSCYPDVDWLARSEQTLAPCSFDSYKNCSWSQLSCSFAPESLEFTIPVGNASHYNVVAMVTVFVIGVAMVVLVTAMLRSNSTDTASRWKKKS